MSGHSKWAQIKRKKAAADAKRGKVFTKLIREITVAARRGGGDPDFNPRLRLAVETAKASNMPAENIARAIERGTGEAEGYDYHEVVYEGYGPGGAALYIETLTDNPNRTVSELRHILDRNGGNLGQAGSVAWQFERKGEIYVDASRYDEDALLMAALESGAEDLRRDDGDFVVTTVPTALHDVQEALRRRPIEWREAQLTMVPRTTVEVEGDDARKLLRILDLLDDADDVQKVHTNADISDAAIAAASA
jgi:YebC/PmpR family DNA-binding regulatory protein